MPQQGKRRCCTLPVLLLVVIVLAAVAGVLIWQFAPINDAVQKVFPNTTWTGDEDGEEPPPTEEENGEEPPPTESGYEFNQCTDPDECCNGLGTICDLRVTEVLFATAHNAMSTLEDGFPQFLFPNHEFALEGALAAGHRGLSIDVCNCGGELQLCHGVCNLGARDPTEVFTNVVTFLQDNPTETLMFNIQINNDVDQEVSLDSLHSLMQGVPNFIDMVYVHDGSSEWPTLRTLVDSNERIVMFHFNGPTNCNNDSCPPGLHYWFDYGAETEFDFSSKDQLLDTARSCEITRGRGNTDFFAITNFVTPPLKSTTSEINTLEFIEQRIADCSQLNGGLAANILYVDYWSIGDLLEVTQNYNSARAKRKRHMLRSN